MKRRTKSLSDRFQTKFVIDSATGCWNWTASKRSDGYGQIGRGGRGNGVLSAHRVSYEIHCGEIPDGMHVLHRCDRKICVNPNHLFLGTAADNMADKVAKGRSLRGEANNGTKLTEADVAAIKSARAVSGVKLAKQFGVSDSLIWAIRHGIIWKWHDNSAMEKR